MKHIQVRHLATCGKTPQRLQRFSEWHPPHFLNRGRATVHRQCLARGEGSTVAAQIKHCAGDLLDLADTPDRMHGGGKFGFARVSFIGTAEHIGVDHGRAYRVDADFLFRVLDRRRLGQADDPGL